MVTQTTTVLHRSAARSSAARGLASRGPAAGAFVVAFLPLVVVGMTHGGYFPTSWGWSALFFFAVTAIVLAVRRRIDVSSAELSFLGSALALLAWILASNAWTTASTDTPLQAERMLVYVGAVVAAAVVISPSSYRTLAIGIWASIFVIATYALATRLFPDHFGRFDSIAGYRLSEPVGYWNALGVLAGMGILLAIGLTARARPVSVRVLAGASTPLLATTLYFTFGRGAWLATAAGLAAIVLLDPRRLQYLAAVATLAPPSALAVWVASRSKPLTRFDVPLAEATRAGNRLAVALAVLAAAAGAAALLLAFLEKRVRVARRLRLVLGSGLAVLVVIAFAGAVAHFGSPLTFPHRAYHAFSAPPPQVGQDLNQRLFSLSGNRRAELWRAAWQEHRAHPWLGGGSGSFELYWMRHRPLPLAVRDAHNLYLETFAELGPIGLAGLLVFLAVPAVAAIRGRRHALVPPLLGAYVAFLVHAAADWDWEVPVVTLSALLCGAAILAAARRDASVRTLGTRARATASIVAVAAAACAFVGLVGNTALASSRAAAARGEWTLAESEARRAQRWAPWSSAPPQLLAEAEAQAGKTQEALASARRAVAKDPGDWFLWFDLAGASRGDARARALARASMLNPLSPEIAESRASLEP